MKFDAKNELIIIAVLLVVAYCYGVYRVRKIPILYKQGKLEKLERHLKLYMKHGTKKTKNTMRLWGVLIEIEKNNFQNALNLISGIDDVNDEVICTKYYFSCYCNVRLGNIIEAERIKNLIPITERGKRCLEIVTNIINKLSDINYKMDITVYESINIHSVKEFYKKLIDGTV